MAFPARNQGGRFEYICDAEADLASIPNPRSGEFALCIAEGTIHFHTGSAWQEISGGAGAGVATDAIWDAAGDLALGTGADTAARLAIGGDGHVLTVSGGTASWQAPGAGSHPAYASHAKLGTD